MSERGSRCVTEWPGGRIEVRAAPRYLAEHSDPAAERFVFGYRIEIAHLGPPGGASCTLLWRSWRITDGLGRVREVRGRGVVGEQPTLAPGERHGYRSYCPLRTASGVMEGAFTFQDERGGMFEARIAPFALDASGRDVPGAGSGE